MPLDLAPILASAGRDLDGVEVSGAAGARSWSIEGREFARETARGLELALDPAVAAAALRTADTHRSGEGPDRISFEPSVLDRFAEDRVRAWFAHAYRRAAEPSERD